MKQNPVYNREMRVSSRSLKLPLIIFLFNGILFLVTLLNMYSVIMQVKATANIQYSRKGSSMYNKHSVGNFVHFVSIAGRLEALFERTQ
jgi:hypothetical protein